MKPIRRFRITGLFGNRDVDLIPTEAAMILVGPNGIGKSSVINVLYFFISRQWRRLLEYKFSEILIETDTTTIQVRREEISGVSELTKFVAEVPTGSRTRLLVDRLQYSNALEDFLATRGMSLEQRKRFAEILQVPVEEVSIFQRHLFRRSTFADPDLFGSQRADLDKLLREQFPSRTLYLPTYRRIEKDLRDIFPDLEERFRSTVSASLRAGRASTHFIDLVSFGMEDVRANFERKAREMRDYSLEQYNSLSAVYLRDVIRGTADKFVSKELAALTELKITNIMDRVSEATLPEQDKRLLLDRVRFIQGKSKSELEISDRFLAHYFTRLVSVNADIARKEEAIRKFVEVCSAYLSPEKMMTYDEIGFRILITDERGTEIDLSALSSGEKQIVSIFSHLYLDETNNQIVVIDEPELSLSVPWQKRFLPDILDSKKCDFIVAVTHSPFIYENRLSSSAIDLRRRTKATS